MHIKVPTKKKALNDSSQVIGLCTVFAGSTDGISTKLSIPLRMALMIPRLRFIWRVLVQVSSLVTIMP